jgi:hypothetical protein
MHARLPPKNRSNLCPHASPKPQSLLADGDDRLLLIDFDFDCTNTRESSLNSLTHLLLPPNPQTIPPLPPPPSRRQNRHRQHARHHQRNHTSPPRRHPIIDLRDVHAEDPRHQLQRQVDRSEQRQHRGGLGLFHGSLGVADCDGADEELDLVVEGFVDGVEAGFEAGEDAGEGRDFDAVRVGGLEGGGGAGAGGAA